MQTVLRDSRRLDSSDFIPKSFGGIGKLIADDFFGVSLSTYNLGYTAIGGISLGPITDSTTLGSRFTASQSGTVTSIKVYTNINASGTAGLRVAIFANTGSNTIGSLIASSSPVNVTNTSPQWIDVPISASVTGSTDYWLFAWGDASGFSSDFTYYADANAISNTIVTAFGNSYPNWSTVGDGVNENYDLGYMSIYAVVEVASGGSYTLTADSGSFTETGQAMTFRASRLITADQQTYTLSGQSVNLVYAKTLTMAQATFTLSGQNANLRANRILSLSQSTFTLSGQALTLKRAERLEGERGNFSLNGQDVNLRPNRLLTANGSTFTLSGQTANLRKASSITMAQAVFTLSGQNATLRYNRRLTANSSSFALSGQNATLVYNQIGSYTLVAHEGLFTLSGQVANLVYTPAQQFSLSCARGLFTLSGQALGIYKRNHIDMNQAVFSLSGQSVNFTKLSRLNISQGSFTLTGEDVTLTANKFKRRYIITS